MRSADKSFLHQNRCVEGSESPQLSLSRGLMSPWAVLGHYHTLTKPTISMLVTLSALPAYLIPHSSPPPLWECLGLLFGVYLMSASAAVFNQLFEWQTDQTMKRTQNRSVPMGYVSCAEAGLFGTLLGVLGGGILAWTGGPVLVLIGLGGHVYYVVLYTLILKKRTAQNIVIGGAAGAVGPLMGAATIGQLDTLLPWSLFALIFLWTPPHFWSLSLKYQRDYAAAGIPMYPVIYGEDRTRKMIFIYSLTLIPVVLSFAFSGLWFSTGVSLVITGYFVYLCWDLFFHKKQSHDDVIRLFRWSCYYALLIFVVLSLEKSVWLWIGS